MIRDAMPPPGGLFARPSGCLCSAGGTCAAPRGFADEVSGLERPGRGRPARWVAPDVLAVAHLQLVVPFA